MKTSTAIILGSILLLFNLSIYVIIVEKGDINTIGLLLTVFIIPVILLGLLSGFFLDLASKRKGMVEKRIWSFVPILLLALLAISEFRLLDADMSFLGVLGLIAFGLTNLVWNIKVNKKTDKNTLHNNI